MRVRRFPVTLAPSLRLGRQWSRAILRRWEQEGLVAGAAPVEMWRLATTRPRRFDWLSALGRGPTSMGLLATIIREAARFDVILVGYAPFSLAGQVTALARWLGKPVVVLPLFHANDPYHHFRSIYRGFERADRILVQTPYGVEFFRRSFPRSIPVETGVGVDPNDFRDEIVSGPRFRQRHGLRDRPVALMVGRKEPAKRWDLAVAATDRLKREDAVLVLIGRDVDGVPIESTRVLHLERVEDQELRDAYDACDLLVHPSENESFGFVLLEAWMRRKPVLGNRRCGAVASVITEGVDGLLADGTEELSLAMDRLLASDGEARGMGAAGRDKVLSRYRWSHIVALVEAVYRDLSLHS